MRSIWVSCVAGLLLANFTWAADPNMRPARDIILPKDVGEGEINMQASPIIDEEGRIRVVQGEKLFIEFKKEGGKLIPLRAYVQPPENKETVEFSLDFREGISTLTVRNPYPGEAFTYQCWTSNYQQDGFTKRNNLPAQPKQGMYEIYEGFVVELVLMDFEITKPVE